MPKTDDSNWGKFAAVGMEVAVGCGLGAAVGYWIDQKYNAKPWGVLIGASLGFASGMYLLIKEAMKANRD